MEAFGAAEPDPGGERGWNTPFPSASSEPRSWQDRMAARAAAAQGSCDGTDRHWLSMSPRAKAIFAVVAAVALALTIVTRSSTLISYAAGLAIAAAVVGGYSLRLDGDTLVSRRFGFSKRTPTGALVRVERYSYRGSTSLRTWRADGHRGPSIPVSGRLVRLDPVAAGHLRRCLDRSDVQWGLGAWDLLGGSPPASRTDASDATTAGSDGQDGPRGVEVAAKPPSRSKRIMAWISVAAVGATSVVLLVAAPLSWSAYRESQRIQHGPEVTAVLRHEWVTAYSDRSGTHHVTHFVVAFDTLDQQLVTTEVHAHGIWTMEPAGDRLAVRYDPTSPRNAELPGAPNNTLAAAVVFTVMAVVVPVVGASMFLGVRRARRRRAV